MQQHRLVQPPERALDPVKGFTFCKGDKEANVHCVDDGVVYYGIYFDSIDTPVGLYRVTLDEWNRMAEKAIEHGATVYSLLPRPGFCYGRQQGERT